MKRYMYCIVLVYTGAVVSPEMLLIGLLTRAPCRPQRTFFTALHCFTGPAEGNIGHCSAACSWCFCWAVTADGNAIRKRTHRSPDLPGSSGTGIPLPGTRSTVSGVIGPLKATCFTRTLVAPQRIVIAYMHFWYHVRLPSWWMQYYR